MRISFDIDGVLYDWHGIVYDWAVSEDSFVGTYDDFWRKIINKEFSKIWGDNLIQNVPLYSKRMLDLEILRMLNYLVSRGHELYYITSRPFSAKYSTYSWFKRNKIPCIENLIFTENGKELAVAENEIDIHVEDMAHNALALKNYTDVILVKKLWNEDIRDQFICLDRTTDFLTFLGDFEWMKH